MLNNKKNIYIWFLAGMLGLAIFIAGYDIVFPTAAVDVQLSRQEVLDLSQKTIQDLGYETEGFNQAVKFSSRRIASAYLQKEFGIEEANKLVRAGIPIWYWNVRYFKELEKEEYGIGIDPATGKLLYLYRSIEEKASGANLEQNQAYQTALSFLSGLGFDMTAYEIKDKISKTLENRIDHSFDWQKKGFRVSEATMRLSVVVQGDKVGGFSYYLKIPEDFSRNLKKESSSGIVLGKLSHLLMLVLLISAIAYLLVEIKVAQVDWTRGIAFVIVVLALHLMGYLNGLSLIWNGYSPTVSKGVFVMMSIENFFGSLIGDSLMIFAFFTLGAIYSKGQHLNYIGKHWLRESVRAFSVAGIFLGYITLFYYIAIRFFDIWMPVDSTYSNVLGTYLPWIAPIVFALSAALHEEVMYRLLACSFIRKSLKKTWLALLIPAVLWGFAHSSYQIYPMYVRGIELTIFGVFIGWVYIRYGLATVVVAHFIINAFLDSFPLLRCGNLQTVISAILVLVMSPMLFLLFAEHKKIGADN